MRLIGGVRPPSNSILLRQFQQCQVNNTSSARLHPVLIESSNLVNDGRSYATSAPSDVVQARKPQRRVSKNERRSMIENYVKKYRETNAGKFPSASTAMKDIGGSYYTVRLILQELIHNSKQPETSLKKCTTENREISANIEERCEDSTSKSNGKKGQQSSVLEEVSISEKAIIEERCEDSTSKSNGKKGQQSSVLEEASISEKASIEERCEDSTSKSNGKKGQQSSVLEEASISEKANIFQQTDKSEDVGTQFHHPIGKPESSRLPDPENNKNLEKLKTQHQQEPTETLRRESQKVPTGDAEPQTRLSVWNNLKSFANGIINLWKRS